MVYNNDSFKIKTFIDSKSLVPRISLRVFDEAGYEGVKRKEIKAMKQAYRHIHDKYGKEYGYLSTPVNKDKSNIYALVVVQDNPYLPPEDVYKGAADELGICIGSKDYNWLCEHIGIVDIDRIEQYIFNRANIMEAVKRNERTHAYNDHWLTNINLKGRKRIFREGIDEVKKIICDIDEKVRMDLTYL